MSLEITTYRLTYLIPSALDFKLKLSSIRRNLRGNLKGNLRWTIHEGLFLCQREYEMSIDSNQNISIEYGNFDENLLNELKYISECIYLRLIRLNTHDDNKTHLSYNLNDAMHSLFTDTIWKRDLMLGLII